MTFVAISDTHNKHPEHLPHGDVLIHAGDVTSKGSEAQVYHFLEWFSVQPHQYKVFIAGNHDFYFENTKPEIIAKMIPENVIYLNDSGVTIEGIKIWGSPIQPWFYDWAFNRRRGTDIRKHWDLIPNDTDILITHGPAYMRLDKTVSGQNVGCMDLLTAIRRTQPQFHICGHIHEAYGVQKDGLTTYINASVLNLRYELMNKPIVFEVERRTV
ncbi:MAG: metallophosphatase domain-containing protein [Saprospiraceae bacterium]|nr:metallophosphatase domain-containing protein [Saprospiraceae bacterium]